MLNLSLSLSPFASPPSSPQGRGEAGRGDPPLAAGGVRSSALRGGPGRGRAAGPGPRKRKSEREPRCRALGGRRSPAQCSRPFPAGPARSAARLRSHRSPGKRRLCLHTRGAFPGMDRPPGDRGKGDPETLGWEFQVRRWRRTRHDAEAPLPCALPPGWGRTVLAPQPPGLGPALPAAAWRGRPAAARLRAPGPRAPAQPRPGGRVLPPLHPQSRQLQRWLLREGASTCTPLCYKTQPHHANKAVPKRYPSISHPGPTPQQPSGCLGPSRDEPRRAAGDPASVGT